MNLIKHSVVAQAATNVHLFCQMTGIGVNDLYDIARIRSRLPANLLPHYADTLDFGATAHMGERGQTILFDTNHVLSFLDRVDRALRPGDYPCPFDSFFIQFSKPIPENLFLHGTFTHGGKDNSDRVIGILVAAPQYNSNMMNVIGLYETDVKLKFGDTTVNEIRINRVTVGMDGEGKLLFDPSILSTVTEEGREDKQRLVNLALLCIAYINSPKVRVDKIATPKSINDKREKKGKKRLDDYYICAIEGEGFRYTQDSKQSIRHVSFMFPVIGHFRTLADGKVVWVRPHYRGLEHGPQPDARKVYEVKKHGSETD